MPFKSILAAFLLSALASVAPAQIATDQVAASTAFGVAIGAVKVDDQNYTSDWLGAYPNVTGIYRVQDDFPWINIVKLGTFFVQGQYDTNTQTFLGASDSNLYLFEGSLGWLYTNRSLFPWFYAYKLPKKLAKKPGWIQLARDAPTRRVYVFNKRKWISY